MLSLSLRCYGVGWMFLMDISLEFDTVGAENPISVDACRSPITDRNSNNNNGHRRQILFLYNNFQHTFSHGTATICIFITRFLYFCRFFEDATLWQFYKTSLYSLPFWVIVTAFEKRTKEGISSYFYNFSLIERCNWGSRDSVWNFSERNHPSNRGELISATKKT